MKSKWLLVGILMVLLGACKNPFFPGKNGDTNPVVETDGEETNGDDDNDVTSYTIVIRMIDNEPGDSIVATPASGEVEASITLNYTVVNTALYNLLDFGGVSAPIAPVTGAGNGTRTYTINPADASSGREIVIIATFEHTNLTPDPIAFTDTSALIVKTYGDAAFTNSITNTHSGSGIISYSSENETVATIDSSGTVTIRKAGSTVITAGKAADEVYARASRSYTLMVEPKPVTISGLSAADKVYDGTTTATISGTALIDGLVGEDEVTIIAGTAEFEDKNVGNGKVVSFSGWSLGGVDAGNYTLQPASVTANITAKPVTITGLGAANKVYDATITATPSGGTINGLISGDTVTIVGTGSFADKNVGNGKPVSFTSLSLGGADARNYSLSTQTASATANITPYSLTGNIIISPIKLTPLDGERTASITFSVNRPPAETESVNVTLTLVGNLPSGLGYNAGTQSFSYVAETAFSNSVEVSFNAATNNGDYSNGTQTFDITIYDGQADFTGAGYDRRIPVTQANITIFNAYANTTNGLMRHYKLTENITLTGINNWTAIGPADNARFIGSFDGQNNTITGLNIYKPDEDRQGFFGRINNGASVRNLGLIGGTITGKNTVGGVVANSGGVSIIPSTVQNCYSTCDVNGTGFIVGGVVGSNYNSSIVENCYSTGNVSVGGESVGGVVGNNSSGSMVRNCYATGAVVSGTNFAGGVVGESESSSRVQNCYATGTVRSGSSYYVGGVVGSGGTVQNSVALVPSVRTSSSNADRIGRVLGYTVGTYSNNYARTSMTVQYNWNGTTGTDKEIDAGLNTRDGASITATQWNDASWWTTAGNWDTANGSVWDTAIWDIANGRLPILRNMPTGEQNPVVQNQ
jgi:hypothetical protein